MNVDLEPAEFLAHEQRPAQFMVLYNVTGQPAMSLPLAMHSSGLPIGVQIAARHAREHVLIGLGAAPGDPLHVFGTPEHRKKVEKAAEEAVKKHYREKGFLHDDDDDDVTKKNLGFYFIFRKGRTEHHVEVKGTSGDHPRFFMTRNENAYREARAWRFAIVTNALGPKPTVRVYDNRRFKRTFKLEPYVYTGLPVIPPKRL